MYSIMCNHKFSIWKILGSIQIAAHKTELKQMENPRASHKKCSDLEKNVDFFPEELHILNI